MPLLWLRLLNGGTGKGGIRQEEGSRLIRLEAEHDGSVRHHLRRRSTVGVVSMENEDRRGIWALWK